MFKSSFTRHSRYKCSNNFKLNVIFGSDFTKSHSTKKDRKYKETQSFTFIKAMIRSNFANFECLFNIEISIFNSSADISLQNEINRVTDSVILSSPVVVGFFDNMTQNKAATSSAGRDCISSSEWNQSMHSFIPRLISFWRASPESWAISPIICFF